MVHIHTEMGYIQRYGGTYRDGVDTDMGYIQRWGTYRYVHTEMGLIQTWGAYRDGVI